MTAPAPGWRPGLGVDAPIRMLAREGEALAVVAREDGGAARRVLSALVGVDGVVVGFRGIKRHWMKSVAAGGILNSVCIELRVR